MNAFEFGRMVKQAIEVEKPIKGSSLYDAFQEQYPFNPKATDEQNLQAQNNRMAGMRAFNRRSEQLWDNELLSRPLTPDGGVYRANNGGMFGVSPLPPGDPERRRLESLPPPLPAGQRQPSVAQPPRGTGTSQLRNR